jgi:glycerol-3-phosphate acyltransferase PlsY
MMMAALPWVMIVVAYLIGGIPIGLLVGRARGVDLTVVGSGNIGASNAMRALGKGTGFLVWLADVLKGFLPAMWTGYLLQLQQVDLWWYYTAAAAGAAVLGHCFSPYLRFRGGKGVSTTLGAVLALDWRVGLLALGVWVLVIVCTRYISVSSMAAALSLPLLFGFLPGRVDLQMVKGAYVVVAIVIMLLVWIRHAGNVGRLLRGEEPRLEDTSPPPITPEQPENTVERLD